MTDLTMREAAELAALTDRFSRIDLPEGTKILIMSTPSFHGGFCRAHFPEPDDTFIDKLFINELGNSNFKLNIQDMIDDDFDEVLQPVIEQQSWEKFNWKKKSKRSRRK